MSNNDEFRLNSVNEDFALRQKNVFEQLYALESDRIVPQIQEETRMDLDEDIPKSKPSSRSNQRSVTKRLRGKESIFKKPQNPVPRNYFNRIPDFKKHPHKWTRYSLDDVKDEDMSDKSNTKTALSFLEELNNRKPDDTQANNEKVDLSKRIVFKKVNKPTATKAIVIDETPQQSESSFRSSKVIMPEYVVGQKVKKDKKKKDVSKGKELKLDHLQEYEDD